MCVCKLRHWCVCACVGVCERCRQHPRLKEWFMCRSSKLGQGERECVRLAFYWERRTRRVRRGIAHIPAHVTNKQTNTQKPIYNFNSPNTALISNIFPFSVCQKNLPLNIKHTCEHLLSLTRERNRIHHDVPMLSTRSVHRDSWTRAGPGRASEGTQPAESTRGTEGQHRHAAAHCCC